uniref:Acyl-CoA dehydrogenase n=1 Tax=Candidatus Kentrum sp. FW TaxID=2126338 RepID=A0A450T4Y3_9GAMM|nr:MAG: Acyl-CoA dehydrogenase [Candidatus Kentron sp. FW]
MSSKHHIRIDMVSHRHFLIEAEHCISRIEPSMPSVLGTYVIVQWMETAAAELVHPRIEEGYISVGGKVSIEHTVPVPMGKTVDINAKVVEVDGNSIRFTIRAEWNGKKIAQADHWRSVMPMKLFNRLTPDDEGTAAASFEEIRKRFIEIGLRCDKEDIVTAREHASLPRGLWKELADKRIFECSADRTASRRQLYNLAATLEGLCYALQDVGIAMSLGSQVGLCLPFIVRCRDAELKRVCLEPIQSGEQIVAFAITEPHGGSDAYNLQTRLSRHVDDGRLVLNGRKWNITNIPEARWIVTIANDTENSTPVAILVDVHWEGVLTSPHRTIGMRGSPIGSVDFENVTIPENYLLTNEGEGKRLVQEAFLRERILAPFLVLGTVDRLCDRIISYARRREVFRKPISNYQYIQKRFTDAKIIIEATRAMAIRTLEKFVRGEKVSMEASISKIFSTNAYNEVVTHMLKVCGSHGYQEQDDIGRLLLDSVGMVIAGGTDEVHRKVIFQEMLMESFRRRKSLPDLPLSCLSSDNPAPSELFRLEKT